MSSNVVIVGAGVQGLSVGVLLLSQGHKVTIVAKGSSDDWNPDLARNKETSIDSTYTSPKAGANWQSFAAPDDFRQQEWDETTFYMLWRLGYHRPCGIMHLPAYQYFEKYPVDFVDPWFYRITPGYCHLPSDQLPPGQKFGITFETVTMNVPKYLTWLTTQFRQRGGKIIHRELVHIADVAFAVKKIDILINCAGFGARTIGGILDYNVYPTRGQTVLVRAPQVTRTIGTALSTGSYRPKNATDEEISKVTYVIPREDGIVVLGGTYQADNPSLEPDPKTAQGIIDRCVSVCPELLVNGKLPEIVEHSVGLRPTRVGGVRLDSQYIKIGEREVLLVNNYGHGGFGFQSSWGCASNVVAIVRRSIGVPVDGQILSRFLAEVFQNAAKL